MNHDNILPSPENDPLVSAEYHTLSTEITPTALDEVVLEQARAATKNAWLRKFPSLWFRPMVFTATLGLTLVLVLELTTTPEFQPIMNANTNVERRQSQEGETILLDTVNGVTKTKPAPVPANAPISDEHAPAGSAEMIESSSKHMQKKNNAMNHPIQGTYQTRKNKKPRFEKVAAFSTPTITSDIASRSCTEEQMVDALKWWQCITGLKEADRNDEAKAELDFFNTIHPVFKPPDSP
jgi:hypothetical protein